VASFLFQILLPTREVEAADSMFWSDVRPKHVKAALKFLLKTKVLEALLKPWPPPFHLPLGFLLKLSDSL
jgi:hypothetical protein